MTEFEDLDTFIKKRKDKKLRECEEKKQRKIDHFFKRIKKKMHEFHPNLQIMMVMMSEM